MSHGYAEDLRSVYLFDRFRLRPGANQGDFIANKKWFRQALESELGWDLLAGADAGLFNAACNFWRIANSNDLRIAMEVMGPRPSFGAIRNALATEDQHLLAPLRYDPTGPQGPSPEAAGTPPGAAGGAEVAASPASSTSKHSYLIETFQLTSLDMKDYDQFVFPMFFVRELLEAEFGWQLLVAGVRLTGSPGSVVHLWQLPDARRIDEVQAALAKEPLYQQARSYVLNPTIEIMQPAGWE